MKKMYVSACLATMLIASCSTQMDDELNEQEGHVVSFTISNYEQYSLDEVTRVSGAEALDHLLMAVFDAATGEEVMPLAVQDKGVEGYGTFEVALPNGTYQLTFLGYNGTRLCRSLTAREVTFQDNYVPQTFLYTTTQTIDSSTKETQSIVLKRAVAAFLLKLQDKIPANVSTLEFVCSKGSSALNPQTALAANADGYRYEVPVTETMKSWEGSTIATYLFMPSEESVVEYQVTAKSANGDVVRQRTFADVPMQVNHKTVCTGKFFGDASFLCRLQVDDAWGSQIDVSF